jgi:hypothetical protein
VTVTRAVCAIALLVACFSACGPRDEGPAYGCTEEGRDDTARLERALKDLSPNVWPADECDEGGSTSVEIDPFPESVTLDSAEATFAERFECGSVDRSTTPLGDAVSAFECTISGVRASVGLGESDGRVWGAVQPDE